jgi:ubiquinone/menaquinone biosynthesis C-methylase UbiE
MPEELSFKDEAASEYDRAFAHVTAYFMPFLLRAAHLAPGMRVLDIATGTGLSAEAASLQSAQLGTLRPPTSRRPWPGRHASV